MSTHPYIPLYVDDYDAATAHLTIEEDGVYSRLIRLCWRTPGCSLPNDHAWIARKIRMALPDFERVAVTVLDEFFKPIRGRLVQKRLKAEYDSISCKKSARAEAGKKGGNAKASKTKDKSPSNATDLPPDTRAFPEPKPNPEPYKISSQLTRDDGSIDLDAIKAGLIEAAGPCMDLTAPATHILAPILALIRPGVGPPADFDIDVIPTIKARAARMPAGRTRGWTYFVAAIIDARDARLQGAPAITERTYEPSSDQSRPAASNARQSRADASLDAAARVVDRRRAERASREGDAGHAAEPARLSNGGG